MSVYPPSLLLGTRRRGLAKQYAMQHVQHNHKATSHDQVLDTCTQAIAILKRYHTTSWWGKVWFLIQELNREWEFLIWSRNLSRNSAALYRKSQDDDTPKDILIEFFSNQDGGLGHITINFDSLFRRLLASTTETNYVALENSLLRCRPSKTVHKSGNRARGNTRRRHNVSLQMYFCGCS